MGEGSMIGGLVGRGRCQQISYTHVGRGMRNGGLARMLGLCLILQPRRTRESEGRRRKFKAGERRGGGATGVDGLRAEAFEGRPHARGGHRRDCEGGHVGGGVAWARQIEISFGQRGLTRWRQRTRKGIERVQ